MPEFQLNTDNADVNQFDEFTLGYIEAMFFADIDTPDHDTEGLGIADLSSEAIAQIKTDCDKFQINNEGFLNSAYSSEYDESRAGNDFYYTRVGHGTGFWDRGKGEIWDTLTKSSEGFGEIWAYQGDDGQIYIG